MRLLNSNIVNFGYPIHNPTTGLADVTVLFYESKPDLSKTVRTLNREAVAVSSMSLKAVDQGYIYHAESSVGVKAIEGSEYWPEYGITLHHPKYIEPATIPGPTNIGFDIPTIPMKSLSGAVLSHPIAKSTAPVHKARMAYASPMTFDCVFRIQRDTKGALSCYVDTSDTSLSQVSIPEGQITNTTDEMTLNNFTIERKASQEGYIVLAQAGDHTTTPIKKTLAYAVFVFTRYAAGNTPTDNVVFGTDVGATGSGAYLELFKTELSTGEYPIITNLRTGIL